MLAPQDIKPLVEKICESFDEGLFDNFLMTDFDGLQLNDYAPSGLAWPIRAVGFIKQLITRQRDAAFLEVLAKHSGPTDLFPGPKTELREFAAVLLAAALPPPANRRPCFVGGRPFINRDSLWKEVGAFSNNQGAQRILLVDGEPGSGKSYSALLVSQMCRTQARYIRIDLGRSTVGEAGIGEFVLPIATRLELTLKQKFDDLAQEARDVLRAGELIVAGLQQLEHQSIGGPAEPWWILVDGLNLPRVGAAIVDLVLRLAQAIDQGECNNIWLVLIGLKPERLTGALPQLVRIDHSTLPAPDHLKEWIQRLGLEHDKELEDQQLAQALGILMPLMNVPNPQARLFWPPVLTALADARTQLGLIP
ncbi:hypothetical protein X770_29090 [Mesorhizobium sp. LSJC269B00]|uniref:hypothetical protein n=1 Tax=Mesorhizobium sp. LSJC269B00 TaxID=1287326 RepID=UPI0003CF6495|nr:hypothetical protein [Mesorhizobium sp. LSJC269B00]ESW81888.1 hypothetical protein X770_29090 [Mesorhizobium sp. LSJC269B00]